MADSEGGAVNDTLITPLMDFYKDSVNLLRRCTKPDGKEYYKIAVATSLGFLAMGVIGVTVKLVHLPINNILIGSS